MAAPTRPANRSERKGISIDYLVSGKVAQGEIVLDPIVAIKADKTLTPKAKRALIALVEELRVTGE